MGKQPQPITQELAQAFGGLILLATVIIYSGARASLRKPPKPKTKTRPIIPTDDEEDDDDEIAEYLDADAAMMYPLVASVVLVSLWAIIKWLGRDIINKIASGVFAFTGIGAVHSTLTSFLGWFLGAGLMARIPKYNITMTQGVREIFFWKFTLLSLFAVPLSLVPPAFYLFNYPYTFSQFALFGGILAFCFGFNALQLVKLDSFRTGTYLLAGLLLYDVWWVFGTTVMVDVATSLDLPIKLLWPKNARMSKPRDFVLLGLGDVVIPGFFVALSLRFDQARFLKSASESARERGSFAKPYFYATLAAYTSSLAATMFIMQYTGHAQPALLYLSPACLLSFVAVAAARGELREAWDWDGEPKRESVDVNSLPEAIPEVDMASSPAEGTSGLGSSVGGVTRETTRQRRVGAGSGQE